jgi:hypothetical protein
VIRVLAAVFLLALSGPRVTAQEAARHETRAWPTPGERRGWFAPTGPVEMAEYLAALADTFEGVSLDTLAWIDGGSVEPDSALPVLLARIRRELPSDEEKARVLVLAGQTGDDLSGTEVALQLVRELALGDLRPIAEDLDVAVVPAVNPWGLLWWIREEPSGVDPTRDHARLLSPATRAVHDLVHHWRPHLVVELREMGPAVYRVQAGLPKHPNVDPDLASYGRFYLLPYVANELTRASVRFREHVAVEPEADGIGFPILGSKGLPDGAYFTPGATGADRARNSFSLSGSLSIMMGVASLGGAEGLPDRAQLLYQSVGYLLEVTAAQASVLINHRESVPSALSLRHVYARDDRQPDLVWLVWNDRSQIVRETTDRWRARVRRQLALPVPAAWVIEPAGRAWMELVAAHGFRVERVRDAGRLAVASYPVGAAAVLPEDIAADLPEDSAADASGILVREERWFPEGAWVVRSDQPRARLLFTLLEPWSQDAPLGRETNAALSAESLELYPVHRVETEQELESLRTEVEE